MSRFNDFISTLDTPGARRVPAEGVPEADTSNVEIIIDKKTGAIRQAGADTRGKWVEDMRRLCERSLYEFLRRILGRKYLTPTLHRPLCDNLQSSHKKRKLRLYPREHCKTTIVCHGVPLHMVIQPAESNCYFPGMPGTDTRILLSGETEDLATRNIRVLRNVAESNALFRGLWPHCVWDKSNSPRSEGKSWNDLALVFPRRAEFPEATVTARGVGGAITGMHPNVLIKDDLISFNARNSEAEMGTAIDWHVASRGLIEGNDAALEFIIGTRWAVYDLYSYIIENDPLMDVEIRSAIEEGTVIYPEAFSLEKLDRLRKEFGVLYPLLYLNTAVGAGVTDFDMADLRYYEIRGRSITFKEDESDLILDQRAQREPDAPEQAPSPTTGEVDVGHPGSRLAWFRSKYGPREQAVS